jgi:hypothetical protein
MEKILIISTSYSDIETEIKEFIMVLSTIGFEVEQAINIDASLLTDSSFMQQYKCFFCIITNTWENNLSQQDFIKAIELINLNNRPYWTVCDQKTIYARTILREINDLDDLPSKFEKHYVYFLIHIYHIFTKEHIVDPDHRFGNWVHPYRILEEVNKYFSTQFEYSING